MITFIFLLALLRLATVVSAQKNAFGVRLAYFTGSYRFAENPDFDEPVWTERPEGLESGVFYRLRLGHSPIYLQTELSVYSRRMERILPWYIPYDHLVDLQGKETLLQIPLIAGGQFGRGKLHVILATGVSYGIFIQKEWQKARYFGGDGVAEVSGGEFGFLGEGGLNYDLYKRLQLGIIYRYLSTQHHLSVGSAYGSFSDDWQTKRSMLQLMVGWKL